MRLSEKTVGPDIFERRWSRATAQFIRAKLRHGVSTPHSNANPGYLIARGTSRGETIAPGHPEELETLLSTLLPDFEPVFEAATVPDRLWRVATTEPVTHVDRRSKLVVGH